MPREEDDGVGTFTLPGSECTVCSGNVLGITLNCRHTFHADCILNWLGTKEICPLCRTSVPPWDHPLNVDPFSEDGECCICLEDVHKGRALNCGHFLHDVCGIALTHCPKCTHPISLGRCFRCTKIVRGLKDHWPRCGHRFHRQCLSFSFNDLCPRCFYLRFRQRILAEYY